MFEELTSTGDTFKADNKAVQLNDIAMAMLKIACADSQRALKFVNV